MPGEFEGVVKLKISFVLSGVSKKPIGGFKVVYEYANRLSERGYQCKILFMCQDTLKSYKFLIPFVRKLMVKVLVSYFPRWFKLAPKVKKVAIFDWTDSEVPDADAIIVAPNTGAYLVNRLSETKGKKYYLIQGFENWANTSEEQLYDTYNLGMTNIVVAKWLKKIVDEHSKAEAVYIPNGLDFEVFGIDNPIGEREAQSVAMLYHSNAVKGCKYGLRAIEILKQKYPQMRAHLFGVPERPSNLPEWIEYTQNASQKQLRAIYNKTAIFICPTIMEGFGLTGAESMACGCALVSTEYAGVLEYAVNNENALLSPVKDAEALAVNVEKLFTNTKLRIEIAAKGNQNIQTLSWEKSVQKMCTLLERGDEV